jgi:biotin carboxyl carrier protein
MAQIISRRDLAMAAGMAALVQGCDRMGLTPPKKTPEAAPAPAPAPTNGQLPGDEPLAPPPGEAPTPPPPVEAPKDAALEIQLSGTPTQGAALIGRTAPGATISIDSDRGAGAKADKTGLFVIGLDRDAPAKSVIIAALPDGRTANKELDVAQRAYREQRVSQQTSAAVGGAEPEIDEWFDLIAPPGQILSLSAEDAARNQRDKAAKTKAFASRADVSGFSETWIAPLKGRVTSRWGSKRILSTPDGQRRAIHYGVDIARPIGTPILAPTSGVVALALPDMVFEGGCVFLDHGQGLISIYLHMDTLNVKVGDAVSQGQTLGTVGKKGRATGPHLCWRMKWRNRNLDPSLFIGGEPGLSAA